MNGVFATPYRIGQLVPSSNLTMKAGIPAMLAARQAIRPARFTFHSSRMRVKTLRRAEWAVVPGAGALPSGAYR